MKDEKKSIVKEALADYKDIQQAADANAKKRLADEFPKEFSNILKEELNKNKSVKESNVDNAGINKESVMKNQSQTGLGKGLPFTNKAKVLSKDFAKKVNEDETFDETTVDETVGDSQPFDKKSKIPSNDVIKDISEERETSYMADLETQTPNQGKGEAAKGRIYNEKIVGPSSGKPMTNMKKGVSENFNLSGNNPISVNKSLDNAQPMDELLTMEQIEEEINAMAMREDDLGGVRGSATPNQNAIPNQNSNEGGIPYQELVEMRDKLDNIIKGSGMNEMHQGNFTTANINKMHQGDYDSHLIDEYSDNMEISEEDINAVLGNNTEPSVDESHGLTNRKNITGRNTPSPEHLSTGEKARLPQVLRTESEKKISSLIEENKKLTKKLNETKKYKETVTGLVESYKSALDKYRGQLKEMAVFNTNLSHVNNLLVNEELALTQEDKVKIINEFKQVNNIVSSEKVYKKFLTEMKGGKKTLTESIETKVSASIQPSSKQKLNEVVEKTAYADDKHIQRMKKIIETIEHRGKKII